jgi:LexA-binding, inner membrane-associated putative hydrolase
MASYRGHLAFASMLGAAYGGVGMGYGNLDWGPAVLAAGLTTVGGLLPDLDSDSGVPVRELFSAAACIIPLLLFSRLQAHFGFSLEQTLAALLGVYLFIRYPLAYLFKRYTVHRGMFHSIPALAIAGLATYLVYHSSNQMLRVYLAGSVTLGFLSHLALDEIYSVDFNGLRLKLNKFAGSALKLASRSVTATTATYLLLGGLIYLTMLDGTTAVNAPPPPRRPVPRDKDLSPGRTPQRPAA